MATASLLALSTPIAKAIVATMTESLEAMNASWFFFLRRPLARTQGLEEADRRGTGLPSIRTHARVVARGDNS